jgi:hypothetical protein
MTTQNDQISGDKEETTSREVTGIRAVDGIGNMFAYNTIGINWETRNYF